ncbi:HTH-type transcriptional regulator CfxR [Rubrivivax sp. A210]|uniref:LysR family transcriptional regulator n=1 Tax=Rubrivivax sp. A210 TaxID=2772301 RepID=UPI001919ECB1|nr:LysR family transcriptional regulator [Rubrivivax sp. A210]CAD5369082.1 HTH-type transcriptional regulator CfxR [Rubrivivax sp. A210]
MNITFRQLRVFVEVAQRSSMARAAEALHLTPPAVSMQIKEIEGQVGLPLFDRHGRALSLSTAGEYFLVHARRLLAALKEADDAMARLKRVEHGLLTIGMVSTAKYFVPHLLARFHLDHPGVEVRLRVVGNREQLVALMQTGEADLSIMGRPPREIATRAEAFAQHPLVFVAPPGHPLLARPQAPVAALGGYALIAREHGSGTRNAMETVFSEHRLSPRIAMEMSSNETIKQAVMAGLGLSFLSLHTVGLELRTGLLAVLDIAGTPVMRTWNVVHMGNKLLSPAAEAFRYFLIEHGQAFLGAQDGPLLRPAA